ncbi:MAG: ABC transporter ATP-binding protein [Magnetococcales bacterium]|nr:ABC transporter ATP-binding protein [Magnetococcales bacterium]
MLRLEDVRKHFMIGPTRLDVLNGVNLTIERGALAAIVGSSGSGKSTLMNIIGLMSSDYSGRYWLDGKEINPGNDDALSELRNRLLGFVFQAFHLLPRLTAVENVQVPLMYGKSPDWKEGKRRAMEMLEKVGMESRAHHYPAELSGGQQQRVAVARALVGRPALILADEPTGALDPVIGQDIMNLFKSLNQEGVTVVIITHDMKIADQCSCRMRMHAGRIVEKK